MDRIEEVLRTRMREKESGVKMRKTALCQDEATLSAYLSAAPDKSKTRKVEAHIANCPFCLESLKTAYEADKLYNEGSLPESSERLMRKAKSIAVAAARKKRVSKNLWLIATIAAFAMSFIFPRYFAQFLVAALILGLKWVSEGENARTLIMVLDAWRHHSSEKDEEIREKINKRF
ncbi:MAG: hypothetical protein V1933_04915 [Candidatus Omnitrophota bacterium]